MLFTWMKFVHLTGVFAFLMAHGVSVAVLFRLRRERDREKMRALLVLSSSTIPFLYVSLLILLAGGVTAAFLHHLWSYLWIWLSLGLLVAIIASMYPLGTLFYKKVTSGLQTRPSGAPVASDEEIDDLLRSSRPIVVAVIGFGGLAAILYLMVFKPF